MPSMRVLAILSFFAANGLAAETTQVDLKPDGSSFSNISDARLSGDGRIAILDTSGIVLGSDFNSTFDVFARDLQTGTLELVSVALNGNAGNGASIGISVSYDGRFVAFGSTSTNLVLNDTNGKFDVFVRDRLLGTTERVSVGSGGSPQGDWDSTHPAISADGRYVSFTSSANTLVPGDGGDSLDIFVHDRVTKITERVNVDASGVYQPGSAISSSLSADGRYVAFLSSQGLVPPKPTYSEYMVKDRQTGVIVRASVNAAGQPANSGCFAGSLSPDGRYAVFMTTATNLFAPDTNNSPDVFLRDLVLGFTEPISVTPLGTLGNGDSAVNFGGTNEISADGRFVTFGSRATDIVFGNTTTSGALLRDRALRTTSRLSLTPDGLAPNQIVGSVGLAWDASRALLMGYASNLTGTPTNGLEHAFLRVRTGFENLHGGILGAGGVVPALAGSGTLSIGGSGSLTLSTANPNTPNLWFLSLGFTPQPFFGGMLATYPPFQIQLGATDAGGIQALGWTIPPIPLLASEAYLQVALPDGAAVQGVALSNVLRLGFQ